MPTIFEALQIPEQPILIELIYEDKERKLHRELYEDERRALLAHKALQSIYGWCDVEVVWDDPDGWAWSDCSTHGPVALDWLQVWWGLMTHEGLAAAIAAHRQSASSRPDYYDDGERCIPFAEFEAEFVLYDEMEVEK